MLFYGNGTCSISGGEDMLKTRISNCSKIAEKYRQEEQNVQEMLNKCCFAIRQYESQGMMTITVKHSFELPLERVKRHEFTLEVQKQPKNIYSVNSDPAKGTTGSINKLAIETKNAA